jgi:hypothetical protein
MRNIETVVLLIYCVTAMTGCVREESTPIERHPDNATLGEADSNVEIDASDAGVESTTTRFGRLLVENVEAGDFKVRVDQLQVDSFEGMAIDVRAPLPIGNRDVVLLEYISGGKGCPSEYVLIDLQADRPPNVSKRFGNCAPEAEIKVVGEAAVIELPFYTAHPDQWNEQELADAESKMQVYIWQGGQLDEKQVAVTAIASPN